MTDACVARAHALARRDDVKVLSLDVFDTLLWRVVPEPVDAFVEVGRSLAAAGRLRVPADAFAPLREAAEHRARERSQRQRSTPEVSLEQVYRELPPTVRDGDPAELAGLELEVERTITFPDLAVVELARSLQAERAVRVVLVSNTYFSASQLRRLLDRDPFTQIRIDAVFTSSDHGRHKGTGLFDVALVSLGVSGREVVHLGDDPDADVVCAARSGLDAVLLTRRPEPLPVVLEREGVARGNAAARRRAPLDQGTSDFGLTALRAKALRRSDGAGRGDRERTSWTAGAAVFGPVFTGFAEWAHERAAAAGAERLFCVMREGAFLAPLLDAARAQRGGGAAVSTMWLSRYVCSQAAVVNASAREIEAFLHRRLPPTLGLACQGLGLTMAQLPELAGKAGDLLDDPVLRRRFVAAVTGDGDVRATVAAHCARARRRMVEHVIRTVGGDTGEAVLVDLGWGATIQAGLDAALRAEGVTLRTRGLYLLTNDAAVERLLDGVVAEGFLGTVGLPDPAVRWIMRSPEILEQVCMPEVGSLMGFDDEGEPVTTPGGGDRDQHAQRQAVQDGILAFQQEWGRYRDVVPKGHHGLDEQARPLLRTMLLRFIVEPTAEEATVFGSWLHDENWGSDSSETVLDGAAAGRLEYMSPLQLLELPMNRLYWPFGLAALHNPPLARAAGAVALGELPADVFTDGEETHATLYVDLGAGLMPRRQPRLRANSRGLHYLRQRVDAHPLRAVGVGFPVGPGLARLDWMRLRFGVRGRSQPVVVDVRWPEADDRLRYHGGQLLSGNLLFGAHRAPRLSFECPDEWGVDVYSAEVELGFGWLPSAPGAVPRLDRATLALAAARRVYPRARKMLELGRALSERVRRP
ncbi:MAG: HAD family hydrolase [Actinomycetota bacterium]|nr:HAD family hydrolase [Actinomycetota bacterium]